MQRHIRFGFFFGILFALLIITFSSASRLKSESVNLNPLTSPIINPQSCDTSKDLSPFLNAAITWVSSRDNTPQSNYITTGGHYVYAPELHTCFVMLAVINKVTTTVDKLSVNTASLKVDDTRAIDQQRDAARDPVVAKIGTDLQDRLAHMAPTDQVQVTVWFKTPLGEDLASRLQRVFNYLVQTYPAAASFMQKYGKPLGPDDSPDSQLILREYQRLMGEGVRSAAISKWTSEFNRRGLAFKDMAPMPAISVKITPDLLTQLIQDTEIERIYLSEATMQPQLFDAAQTHRLLPVWAAGITGQGQTIAIVEAGNVQRNNTYLNYVPVYLVGSHLDDPHATNVAAAAASTYEQEPGTGRSANILSAGTDTTQAGTISALQWATSSPQNARIANNSEDVYVNDIQVVSRGFDYWARYYSVFVTASGGNIDPNVPATQYVGHPAVGWNVLAVGRFDNYGTGDWADDQMSNFSSWKNPPSTHGDHEKPEVVAVGENLTMWGSSNILQTESGSSFSAPQVAGLGALLRNKSSVLQSWPEAMRAIVMASAIHNIEGVSWITPNLA